MRLNFQQLEEKAESRHLEYDIIYCVRVCVCVSVCGTGSGLGEVGRVPRGLAVTHREGKTKGQEGESGVSQPTN